MATPFQTPYDISRDGAATGNTTTVTWAQDTAYTNATYKFKFTGKTDPTLVEDVLDANVNVSPYDAAKKKMTAVVTLVGEKKVSDYAEYVICVQAVAAATDTANSTSAWGQETIWAFAPTINITIGSYTFTLSQDSFAGGSGIYRLPVSKENPAVILYDDLKTWASGLGLTLRSTFPNGVKINSSLFVNELVVNTTKKIFSIDVEANLQWNIITGLTVNQLGVAVKRTDGTI